MIYDFYIRRPDGKFYKGSVHGDDRDWATNSSFADRAFGFSEDGAHKKMAAFPEFFTGCVVVRSI